MLNIAVFLFLLLLPNLAQGQQLVFEEPPENFRPKIEVVGCFITVGDDFLFLKQQPYDSEPNTWAVPGGKVSKKETPDEANLREIYEETGLDLKDSPPCYLGKVYIRLPEHDFLYHMFEIRLDDYPQAINIDPAEHTEYRWMTLKTALELPLLRGEEECIHLIYGKPQTWQAPVLKTEACSRF